MRSLLERAQQTEAVDKAGIQRAQRGLKDLLNSAKSAGSALEKLAKDPEKFAPQADNLKQNLREIERQVGLIRRKLGI